MSTLANRTSPGGRQHQLEPRLTTGVDGASLSESAASARREVYIVPHFLDRGTCVHLRAAMDGSPSVVAEILAGTFASDAHVRKALSIDVATEALNTIESRLDAERGALSRFFGTALTAREGADFLRYHRLRGSTGLTVIARPGQSGRRRPADGLPWSCSSTMPRQGRVPVRLVAASCVCWAPMSLSCRRRARWWRFLRHYSTKWRRSRGACATSSSTGSTTSGLTRTGH